MLTKVTSGITPIRPITDALTEQRIGQAAADLSRSGNLYNVLKGMPANTGFSRGPAAAQRALPTLASTRAARAALPASLRLADAQTNNDMYRQGASARDLEATASAQIAAAFDDLRRQRAMQGMGLLQALMGAN